MAEYIITEHPDYPYEEPKPQELIRCKDCLWWDEFPSSSAEPNYHRCKCWSFSSVSTTAEEYCARAERKEGEVDE